MMNPDLPKEKTEESKATYFAYLCKYCGFNFDYEGDMQTLQCPKCRCEEIINFNDVFK